MISFVLGLALPALLLVPLTLVIGLAVFGLVFFAIPRVAFDDVEPITALKESLAASLANIVPLLVYIAIVIAFGVVLAIVFAILMFIPILGWLVGALLGLALVIVGLPWSAGISFYAYEDVFGGATAMAPPPAPM